MSIFGPSWASGDQITRTKQANMVADGVNTTDDIHKQYNQKWYSASLIALIANNNIAGGSTIFEYRFIDNTYTTATIIEGRKIELANPNEVAIIIVGRIGIKLLPSHSFINANINYKMAFGAASAGTRQVKFCVTKNGTNIANTLRTPTQVYPNFDTQTEVVALGLPSANDYIDVSLSLYGISNNPSAIIMVKDIEIYLS